MLLQTQKLNNPDLYNKKLLQNFFLKIVILYFL